MKWLLQNVRQRAGFALRNPRYALHAMIGELTLADEKFLSSITGSSPRRIRAFLDEPINTPAFASHLRDVEEEFCSLAIDFARNTGVTEARILRSVGFLRKNSV